MPDPTEAPFYWTRFGAKRALPPGDELAALRRGLGRRAGEVPQMWPHYLRLTSDGRITPDLHAEHLALTLFAVHQQSQSVLMHSQNVGLGMAVRALRDHKDFSKDGVDRRFGAAATASSFDELAGHLRSLVSQLNQIRQPLDYTQLVADLRFWQYADGAARVRRRWGLTYFAPPNTDSPASDSPAAQEAS